MTLTEKYPNMRPNPRMIEQCLNDSSNFGFNGKRRHPKFSSKQWDVRTHVFDVQDPWFPGKPAKRCRINEVDDPYIWDAINKMLGAIADRQWASETNYRITKYHGTILKITRYELKMLYYITDKMNEKYGSPGVITFRPEGVQSGLNAYLDRATNGQLAY